MPASLEDANVFFHHELNAIRIRLVEHRDFYQYCLSGATHLDKHYFLRGGVLHLNINLDPDFSTGYDMTLAAILADSLLREHLLEKLDRQHDDATTNRLSWTASKSDLVELIYALHQAGSINGGNADIGQIASTFESLFNIELGNYYRTYTDIRMRKKNVAVFLEKLQNDFMRKVSDADN
jgi:prenyltransferase beta subunit